MISSLTSFSPSNAFHAVQDRDLRLSDDTIHLLEISARLLLIGVHFAKPISVQFKYKNIDIAIQYCPPYNFTVSFHLLVC